MHEELMSRPAKQKAFVSRRSGVGTGTTSLLMIFTVLCFATLAMLSLSTAASSRRIQMRGLESGVAAAAAKGLVAKEVSVLDEKLLELSGTKSGAEYTQSAVGAALALGWQAGEEPGQVLLAVPVDGKTELLTVLELALAEDGARYVLVKQITNLKDGWAPEEEGGLLLF